ncbi:MAG: DUF6448 family protein [Bacteroidota bacterium]
MKSLIRIPVSMCFLWMVLFLSTEVARAHCDTMDGPVVKAARSALETGNVNHVLVWVQKKDEGEITLAFKKTLAVRMLSPEARELGDRYFFETLVRIHRAGEGAPYEGLKPAGSDVEPGIEAADHAIEKGTDAELLKNLIETIQHGVHEQFSEVLEKKSFKPDDVTEGREYVRAYVTFLHYVERIVEASRKPANGHLHEAHEVGMKIQNH